MKTNTHENTISLFSKITLFSKALTDGTEKESMFPCWNYFLCPLFSREIHELHVKRQDLYSQKTVGLLHL